MSILEDMASIQARQNLVENYMSQRESWMKTFETFRDNGVDWIEAQAIVQWFGQMFEPLSGCILVWAATVYDKLDEISYDDDEDLYE